MFHTIDFQSIGGGLRSNEDICGAGEGFAFVIDGATSLSSNQDPSNGYFFVQEVAQSLEKFLPDLSLSLAKCLEKSLENLNQQRCEGASASILLLREVAEGKVEIFSLGDCALLEKQGDKILEFFDDSVSKLDQKVIDRMVSLGKQQGLPPKALRNEEEIQEMLLTHRGLKNTPDGYWIFDPSGVGIPHGRHEIHSVRPETEFLLMSDGFHIAFDFGLFSGKEEAFKQAKKEGLSSLITALRQAEEGDCDYVKVPRLKQSDDCTVLYGKIL